VGVPGEKASGTGKVGYLGPSLRMASRTNNSNNSKGNSNDTDNGKSNSNDTDNGKGNGDGTGAAETGCYDCQKFSTLDNACQSFPL
jgi:hypothetical protein